MELIILKHWVHKPNLNTTAKEFLSFFLVLSERKLFKQNRFKQPKIYIMNNLTQLERKQPSSNSQTTSYFSLSKKPYRNYFICSISVAQLEKSSTIV